MTGLPAAARRAYDAVLLVTSRGVEWSLNGLFRALGRWVPEDVFISYARADGSRYAMGLAAELAGRNRNCITDIYAAEAGHQLPPGLIRSLRRARQLVVLGTEGALQSRNIEWEIRNFPAAGRSVVIIGFCDGIKTAPWFPDGFEPQYESSDRLASGEPSPEIVKTILQAYRFKTQQQRLALFGVGVVVFVLVAAAMAAYYTLIAWNAELKTANLEKEMAVTSGVLRDKQEELASSVEKSRKLQTQIRGTSEELGAKLKDLASTSQRLEVTQSDLRLAEARRTVLDVARRRRDLGFTPIEHVLRTIRASRDLIDSGFPVEAELAVREEIELLPIFRTSLHVNPDAPVILSADPPLLFVASGDSVEIRDPLTGRTQRPPLRHAAAVRRLQLVDSGKSLLVVSEDGSVTLWDPVTSAYRHRDRCVDAPVGPSAVSAGGRFLGVACGGAVRMADLRPAGDTHSPWTLIPDASASAVVGLGISDEVLTIVSADDAGMHRLTAFSLKGGRDPEKLVVDPRCIGSSDRWPRMSDGGGTVLSSQLPLSTIGIYDLRVCNIRPAENGLLFHVVDLKGTSRVVQAEIGSPLGVGMRIVTVDLDHTARLLDGQGAVVREMKARTAAFSRDARHVLLTGDGDELWVLDSASGEPVAVLPRLQHLSRVESNGRPVVFVSDARVESNGRLVAFVSDGEIQVWEIQALTTPEFWASISPDTLSFLDSDEALVGSETYGNEGRAHRLTTWILPRGEVGLYCQKLEMPASHLPRLAFSCRPDRQFTDALRLVDVAYQPGRGLVGLEHHNGEHLAWHLDPQREIHRWKSDGDYMLTADGTLAIPVAGRFRVVDLLAARELRPVESDRNRIIQVLRSPQGPLLALRSHECSLSLVGLERGDVRARIDECATRAALSRDGRFVVVGAGTTVAVWDLVTARWIARRDLAHRVTAVAMSRDQKYVAAATRVDSKGRLAIWRWRWADVREAVCHALEQNLKAAQWATRVPRGELAKACASMSATPRSNLRH